MRVDSLTHILVAWILLQLVNAVYLLPFAILGAFVPDLDVVGMILSEKFPRLYIFTHGGFTHSVLGAAITATAIYTGCLIAGFALRIPVLEYGVAAFIVVLAMGYVHLLLDSLAYPGIPLLYPFSRTKYTWGVFPGPSLIVLAITLVFLASYPLTYWNCPSTALYVVAFASFITASIVYKAAISIVLPGKTIPTFNPVVWLTIEETPDAVTVRRYMLFRGFTETRTYRKWDGVQPAEIEPYRDSREVERLRYNSYFTIAARDDTGILLRDPMREDGFIFYPNHHTRVHLPGTTVSEELQGTQAV